MQLRSIFPVLLSFGGIIALATPLLNGSVKVSEPSADFHPTGANTISYSLNDNSIDNTLSAEVVHENNLFYLNLWLGAERQNRITFVLKEEEISAKAYELDDPNKRYLSFSFHQKSCTYASDEYFTGMLMINTFDQERKIIAGSFEFVAFSDDCNELVLVRDGQFDARF